MSLELSLESPEKCRVKRVLRVKKSKECDSRLSRLSKLFSWRRK